MSLRSSRASTFIRRALARYAEPRQATVASVGVAGYTGFDGAAIGFSDARGTLDLRALMTYGLWTDDGWTVDYMRLITGGYLS